MNKFGVSPLIVSILLIGLTVASATGVLVWVRMTTLELEDDVPLSPININFEVEFKGVENCESSETEYCYEIQIINKENLFVNYLVTTTTPKGKELENPSDYRLGPYASKIFRVYYSRDLGTEDITSKVDVSSLY